MYEKTVVVTDRQGLHARPAARFVMLAKRFKSSISLCRGEKSWDAKSMVALLSAGVVQGTELRVSAEGPDEQEAVDTLCAAVKNGLET